MSEQISWRKAIGISTAVGLAWSFGMAFGKAEKQSNYRNQTYSPVAQIAPVVEKPKLEELTRAGENGNLERAVNIPIQENTAPKKMPRYSISSEMFSKIKSYEGFSEEPYLCPARKWTIGYGHVIKPGENYSYITPEQAERIFVEDIAATEILVRKSVKVKLNQRQLDALCSLAYNIGEENFRDSTLLKKLNRGGYNGAGREFNRWIYSKGKKLNGLRTRREEERKLFLNQR